MAGTVSSVGAGASAQMIGHNESQGAISLTGNPLDLAIEGEGYFQVKRPDGSTALTRDGTFSLNSAGQIVNAEGDSLIPPISLPSGTSLNDVMISSDGTVRSSGHTLGQIKLVTVTSEDHLLNLGGELLAATTDSGEPHAVSDSTIHQGALEDSNVNVSDEMTQMMSTQRSYQLASSAIQTESQMMSIANQLRS
jgi:flagellar basal-body rod protein FlgG